MNKLELKDVSKRFGEKDVLSRVSLTIKQGEFVTLLGPSGSGKSTIFHLVGGLLTPDSGEIYLEDQKINGKAGHISYMPQTPSLLPWRTVIENVLLGQELVGEVNEKEAKNMLQKAGLAGFEGAYPHELSGGMKQRVSFIRALLSPQPFILLDEPFSALDELTRSDMQKWLLSVWEEERPAVLFITHNIEEALFLSDRVLVLSDRPASIKAEFQIPFERPRREEILLSMELLEWKKRLYFELY
ncbi:ABC transporter ATP-binding protein [Bacillus sp. 2205SS5-2]|uniref:ABC transporter ATP-binding protein n=1 Tax=Bacillus sp. 2205SS5-2 TaxID=3109031 RepID=UPI003004AA2A